MGSRNRILRMFYYLTQTSQIVTAKELADYTGVSVRTVKNDVDSLKAFCSAAGCSLISKRGDGYRIRIEDENAYSESVDQILRLFSDYNYTQEYGSRVQEIVRELLVADDFCRIDDIAEEMFLSRSTIKNSIRLARSILSSFHLSLESKPGYGIRIRGEEINIRYCMLELFINHDTGAISLLKNTRYREFFETDVQVLADIRHTMLKVLRSSSRTVLDSDVHRIVRYLSLMARRYKKEYRLSIMEKYRKLLLLFPEYHIAEEIIKAEKAIMEIPDTEEEIMGLEILLLFFSDPYDYSDIRDVAPQILSQADDMAKDVFEGIKSRWNVDLSAYFPGREFIATMMVPTVFRITLKEICYVKIGKDIENNGISASPLSVAMAYSAWEYIEKKTEIRAINSQILDLAIRLYTGIRRIRFHYDRPKVLVASRAGKQACQVIIEKIIDHFGKDKFSTILPIGFYEVRGLNQNEYDWMIINYNHYYYHYSLPYIYVDTIPTRKQIDDIHEELILQRYDLDSVYRAMHFRDVFLFRNFPYSGRKAFINMLGCRNAKQPEDIEGLIGQLDKKDDLFVWNETVFLIVNSDYTNENRMEVYVLEKKSFWNRKEIRNVVFISVDFNGNDQAVKFVEVLTNSIAVSSDSIEILENDHIEETLIELVRSSL